MTTRGGSLFLRVGERMWSSLGNSASVCIGVLYTDKRERERESQRERERGRERDREREGVRAHGWASPN